MQKKEIAWIVGLLLAVGASFAFFNHHGEKEEIQIFASFRPIARRGKAPIPANFFTLDGAYKLNRVKVTAFDTNNPKAAGHVFWNLVSKSNSAPVKIFQYGQNIQGMEPDQKGVQAEPLIPGDIYLMEVTAGKLKGTSKPFTLPVTAQ